MKICPALNKLMEGSKNSVDFSRRGKNLVQKNQLAFPCFEAWPLPDELDWESNPFKNRSWQWRLHSLSFLPWLMADHWARKDMAALDKGLRLIRSWLNCWLESEPRVASEFAWHDHGSALRAENILLFLAYVSTYSPDWTEKNRQELETFHKSLYKHGEYLVQNKYYSRHTNHGLEQSRVLMLLGTELDRSDWLDLAAHRIRDEFAYSFTCEGVHKENSPGYHAFVLNTFLNIFNSFPEDFHELKPEIDILTEKALNFLVHAIRPDGRYPILGDTEHIFSHVPVAKKWRNDVAAHYLFSRSEGKEGIKPTETIGLFPASGYAFLRNSWDYEHDINNIMHLVVKAGSLGRYHYHQDEGNILLYAFGEDWLIDSGMYNYNNSDPVRKYIRSRYAHNIPIIASAIYKPDPDTKFTQWSMGCEETGDKCKINMLFNFFQGFTHIRNIEYYKNYSSFNVVDEILGMNNDNKEVFFYWHFPADKKIEVNYNMIKISSQKTDKCLYIDLSGQDNLIIEIGRGQTNGLILSCVSWERFKYEDSACAIIKAQNRLPLKLNTYFHFDKGILPEIELMEKKHETR